MDLRAHTLIGRSRRCDLRVDRGEVSAQHARLRWQEGSWVLEDLGSRNGTYVDGHRLEPPEQVELRAGMRLAFGQVSSVWEVLDASPPRVEAVPLDGGRPLAAVNGVLLFGLEGDAARVDPTDEGWILEVGAERRTVRDQEQVEIAGRRWVLHLPTPFATF